MAAADSEAVSNAALRRSEEQRDASRRSRTKEHIITSCESYLAEPPNTTSALDTAQTEAGVAERPAVGPRWKSRPKGFRGAESGAGRESPGGEGRGGGRGGGAGAAAAVLAGAVAAERRERVVVEAEAHRAELALADERVSMAEGRADAAEKAAAAAEAARSGGGGGCGRGGESALTGRRRLKVPGCGSLKRQVAERRERRRGQLWCRRWLG